MYSFGIDRFADNKFPAVEALSRSTNPNVWVPTKNTDAINNNYYNFLCFQRAREGTHVSFICSLGWFPFSLSTYSLNFCLFYNSKFKFLNLKYDLQTINFPLLKHFRVLPIPMCGYLQKILMQ
jgi:ABC-type antimicrobial peptide transport system permease subunit